MKTMLRLIEGTRTWALVVFSMWLCYRLMMADKLTPEGIVAIVGAIGTYAWRATRRDKSKPSDGKE